MAYVQLRDGDGLWVAGSAPMVRAFLMGEGIISRDRMVRLCTPDGEAVWVDREWVAGVIEEQPA